MARKKILVVDDDEAVLDLMQAKLGAQYDLISTNAPGNVVQLARDHQPSVIVCDVDMPDADGGDVSRMLFDDPEVRDIPVLFLTSLATPDDLRRTSGQLGGRPALSKKSSLSDLIALIEQLTLD